MARRTEFLPEEVAAIVAALDALLARRDGAGRRVGSCKCGVYAFYDYDAEPIYVGQTYEGLSARIGRHLTNQRSDAVAMGVLDPFEVAEVALWPLWDLDKLLRSKQTNATALVRAELAKYEYSVFQSLLAESQFGAILNEQAMVPTPVLDLPAPLRSRVVPDDVFARREHRDLRIARRANTIAKLAQVISERGVSVGLRKTLLTQALRLQHLAQVRLAEVKGEMEDDDGDELDST